MKIIKIVLLFILLDFFWNPCCSQIITVISADDQQSIPSVHIICRDLKTQNEEVFLTDLNGKTDLSKILNNNSKIQITISFTSIHLLNILRRRINIL
jgi:hypothetical protein